MKPSLRKPERGLIVFLLTILTVLACQSGNNPPGELFLLSPTPGHTANPVATISPTPDPFATIEATIPPAGSPAPNISPTPGVPDLNGVWDDNGHLIVVVQSGLSVEAAYIEERICDHRDGTGATTPFRHDFTATLSQTGDTWNLTGETTICAFGSEDTSANGVKLTDMQAVVSADFNTIAGDWFHPRELKWVEGGLSITRQFENGSAVPTPMGFTLPTALP